MLRVTPCCCFACSICNQTPINSDFNQGTCANWVQQNGTWVPALGKVTSPATNNAFLECGRQPSQGYYFNSTRLGGFNALANNDELRLIADYVDANNFKFAEFYKINSSVLGYPFGYVRLGEYVSGTKTVYSSMGSGQDAGNNSGFPFTLCIKPDRMVAKGIIGNLFGSATTTSFGCPATWNNSFRNGIGTGVCAHATDFATFDLEHEHDASGGSSCVSQVPSCSNLAFGQIAAYWDITFAGDVGQGANNAAIASGSPYRTVLNTPLLVGGPFAASFTASGLTGVTTICPIATGYIPAGTGTYVGPIDIQTSIILASGTYYLNCAINTGSAVSHGSLGTSPVDGSSFSSVVTTFPTGGTATITSVHA